MSAFGAYASSFRNVPYAPLELYLMGLLPGAEVPPIQMLTAAKSPVFSPDNKSATVEASGVKTLAFADIQARHGTIEVLAADERHFDAAFVVLSAKSPASAAVMTAVADYAAIFGSRKKDSGAMSFEEAAGGRATMNTVLGPRRKVSDAPPAARAPFTCDVITQDCARPELTCTIGPPTLCTLPGAGQLNASCAGYPDCGRGLACVSGNAAPDQFVCQPYCDLASASAANACAKSAHSYLSYKDTAGKLSGICLPN
jgi:hypothetical protein